MGKAVSRCITVTTVIDGENGTNGYNTAVVQLFRRYTPTQGAPIPARPNGTLTYTFSTGKLAGSYFHGWSQDMPSAASGEKLFVTMATARSTEATDSIAANEWSTPVEYVADGANGISQAPVIIYKRYATQPTDKPADGAKYYFKTVGSGSSKIEAGSLVGTLNGWSTAIPANTNGLPCWTRQATAVAPATADYDEIAASEWSDPATKLVEDGNNAKYIYVRGTGWNHDAERILNITSSENLFSSHQQRGLVVARINRNTLAASDITWFDVYGGSSEGSESAVNANSARAKFITYLTNTTADYFLAIASRDAVGFNDAMVAKLREFGLGKLDYTAVSGFDGFRTPFAFLGYRGLQQGYALYQLRGTEASDPYAEAMAYIANGVFMSAKDGEDGAAAVQYSISFAGTVLAYDPNTGKLIVSIVGRVYKTEGDTTTPYTALTKSNLYLYFEKADGSGYQVPAEDFSVSGSLFTTTFRNGENYSNEVFFGVRLSIDNVIKARESIQVVKYGTNGQSITGHTGRFFYYAGVYNDNPGSYRMEETQGPYVQVTNGENIEFWMLDFKGVEPDSFPATATEAPSDQSTQWTKMSSEQQYYIARAFFGEYAHFGSFIINDDWMISQYGTLANSIGENVTVNADNVNTLYDGKVPYAWFDPFFINGAELCRDVDVTVSYILAGSASFKGNKTYKIKITATNLDKGGSAEAVMKCRMYNGSNVGDTIQLTPSEPTAILEFTPTATGQYSLRCDMSTNGASGQVTAIVTNQFIPIFAVDGLTGETYQDNAHVRGRIVATSGEFTGKVTAQSGDIAGPLDVTGELNVKDSSNVIKVQINGGIVSTGISPGEITIVDAEGFYVKRGDEGFRLTTQGFQRWNSGINEWVNFYGGRYVRTIKLTSNRDEDATLYNVSVNDDFIIAEPSVNDTVLNLPSSNIPDGKILAVVNTGPGIHIRAGSLKIQGAREYDQVTLNINDRMEFIYSSSSNKWYANFMSKVDNG